MFSPYMFVKLDETELFTYNIMHQNLNFFNIFSNIDNFCKKYVCIFKTYMI